MTAPALSHLTRESKEELYRLLVTKEARAISRSLRFFIAEAWPVVEPSTPFLSNWHIDVLAEHLEAVSRGEIRKLIVNIPPRCAKSLNTSVFWPAWSWTREPESRWIFVSYADQLATALSVKRRTVISSAWYQERWGDRVTLSSDQNVKTRFSNTATGQMLSTSSGSDVLGEGGKFFVVDDPQNPREPDSEEQRNRMIDFWRKSLASRADDPKTGGVVVIMQRLGEKDFTGFLLTEYGKAFTHVCLPMRYEPKHFAVFAGDPRTEPGELLWPARYGEAEVADLEAMMGSLTAAGQLQQRPAPPGGAIFKREWWQSYREPPAKFDFKIMSLDTAYEKKSDASYSVATVWGLSAKAFYLLDVWRDRVEFPELKRAASALAAKWKPNDVLIEDKASGKSLIQEFKRETRLPIRAVKVDRDKISRAHAVTPLVEAERCYLPESAPWLYDYLEEMSNFPGAANDDQVDSTTQALAHLRTLPGKFVVHTVGDVARSSAWDRF